MYGYDSYYQPTPAEPNHPPTLVWRSYREIALYHPSNPDGLYLIRDNNGKKVSVIEMKKRNWNSTIGFEEYALLHPVPPDGWTFKPQ
jgi:hypothetical protein